MPEVVFLDGPNIITNLACALALLFARINHFDDVRLLSYARPVQTPHFT